MAQRPIIKALSPLSGKLRTKALRAKWSAKHRANKLARAAINKEYRGAALQKSASSYHEKLEALRLGLY